MKKEEAEALKLQIIERRNYFKQLDHPLVYPKTQLHSGMQGRVVRQEDRRYMRDVRKGGNTTNKNLKTIDKYISDLSIYNNRPILDTSEESGTPVVPEIKAPVAPSINLTPKIQMRRKVRRGIGGY